MTKVFTTEFFFRGMIYAALVTLHKKRGQDHWQVHLYDPTLYKFIPDGELVFTAEGRLRKPRTLQHAQAEQLVECISEAISAHLKEGGRN